MLKACSTKPQASQGETVNIQRALFNTATVVPGSAATSTSTRSPSLTSSSSSTSPSSSTPSSGGSGLSTGAAVGIGVGCGLAALLFLGLIIFFLMRRRKSKRNVNASGVEQKPLNQEGSPYQSNFHGQGNDAQDQRKEDRNGPAPVEMYQSPNELHSHERYEMAGAGQISPREERGELDGRSVQR